MIASLGNTSWELYSKLSFKYKSRPDFKGFIVGTKQYLPLRIDENLY